MMYKAVLLLVFFVAVTSGDFTVSSGEMHMLGTNKCTWGPSYWCGSLENAQECKGSEQHCREKVWIGNHPLAHLTEPIPEEDSMENPKANCALCEIIGKKIIEKLTINATEEQVVAELEQACRILPVSYQESCDKYVEEYGKMFYEAFVKTADVHELCVLLGLCSEEFLKIVEDAQLITAVMARGVQGIPCDACKSLMALVQKEVLANQETIEGQLDEVCAILPVDQDECDAAINQMFEAAVQIFENYTPLQLCQVVTVCASSLDNNMLGLGPVQFGQEGQTGEASSENMVF